MQVPHEIVTIEIVFGYIPSASVDGEVDSVKPGSVCIRKIDFLVLNIPETLYVAIDKLHSIAVV